MPRESNKMHLCGSEGHAHHWVLDRKSFGVCKYCGARKQFISYVSLQPGTFGVAKSESARVQGGLSTREGGG